MDQHYTKDRRVQRTRRLLQSALYDLVSEKPYDSITVSDITERANLGRTTFYSHFKSKEELFISVHDRQVHEISLGLFGDSDLLSDTPATALVDLLKAFQNSRKTYQLLRMSSQSHVLMSVLKDRLTESLTHVLHHQLDETCSSLPFNIVAHYIAGGQLSLLRWWMDSRSDHTAEQLAGMMHQIQVSILRNALGT